MTDSQNPFVNQNYSVETFHEYTKIPPDQLIQYPFKTLNRLLDDIKWVLPFKSHHSISILAAKPIDYASDLAKLVNGSDKPSMIMLNNELPFFKSKDIVQLNGNNENQSMTTLRGLIIHNNKVNHFTIQILENKNAFFKSSHSNGKFEYHIIPELVLSSDDLRQFSNTDMSPVAGNLLDRIYAMTLNGESDHILRISVFSSEFSPRYLESLTNSDIITKRYLKEAEQNSNLNKDTPPNSLQCIQKLINVLRGPLTLEPGSPLKTINLETTSLASMVDLDILLDELSFTKTENTLVPPSLQENPGIRDSYLRKVLELIFIGKSIKVPHNEFNNTYSFSDSLSLIYGTFNEYDKQYCQTYGMYHTSNEYPAFISLSCCNFFQDELIIKCFENSVRSDPENEIFYVDYLKVIVDLKSNGSSKLRSYVNNQSRRGQFLGYTDYLNALTALGIQPPDEAPTELLKIEDDYVISLYASNVKSDFKNYIYFNKCLQKIGQIKRSSQIANYLSEELIPIDAATAELGIEEVTEDEVVITAFEFKAEEIQGSEEIIVLNKALVSLAVNRKSFILTNYIEFKFPMFFGRYMDQIPVDEAYKHLDVDSNTNDFNLISSFQSRILESDIRELRQALRSINNYRQSKIISHYLQLGKIDPSLLPAENWPAGLDNIGNTCYLNSLLQYYFSIKPIRDMVLEFEERDIEMMRQKQRKIGGRSIEIEETKRANQFMYRLQALFNEMISTDKRCVAPAKELAFLSFLPASQSVNFLSPKTKADGGDDLKLQKQLIVGSEVNDPIVIDSDQEGSSEMDIDQTIDKEIKSEDNRNDSDSIEEIENPFVSNKDDVHIVTDGSSSSRATTPEELGTESKMLPIDADAMEDTIEIGRQQDVTECIENVNFQIETALDPEIIEDDGEQFDIIKKLFYGKTNQTITPLSTDNESSKARSSVERFSSLIINISDHPKDIYDALDNYFNADIVKLEEGLVKKSLTVTKLPDILQFQVQRVLFDRERLMAYKSIEPIPFTEKLYVDRYLETDNKDVLDKREEVFNWKSEIVQLQEKRESILRVDETSNLNIIDSLITTKKYLESIKDQETFGIDEDTIEFIGTKIDSLKQEISDIDAQINQLRHQITNQFNGYTKVGYSVFAVFIHRGEASYGHYWIYIKDPHHNNVWRKYNDEIVTEVPASEVFNFMQGNTATPYYIAYVKEALENDYVKPLNRIVKC